MHQTRSRVTTELTVRYRPDVPSYIQLLSAPMAPGEGDEVLTALIDVTERRAAKRRVVSGGCRELAEVANEQPRHAGAPGRSSPVARATSSASS